MTVSVIIPSLNRPQALKRALAALARSNFPRDEFEVIVVDDGGSVPLDGVIAEAQGEINVILARQSNSGPGSARNTGARLASGCFLALMDDDCEPDNNWLRTIAQALKKDGDVLAGGTVVNGLPNNLYAEASQRIIDLVHRHFNRDPGKARFFTSNNFAIPARLHRRIGGFDQAIRTCGGEDREYCDRWLSQGCRMVWVKDAVVFHSHEMGFRGYIGQHFRYGRGACELIRARRRRGVGPSPFEGWAFHARFLAPPTRLAPGSRVFRLWLLIGLAQLVTLGGFSWEWARGLTFGSWLPVAKHQR